MALLAPATDTLHELLILKLNALHYVEESLAKALPKMAKAASDPDLREAFTEHTAETVNQAKRIEDALSILGEKVKKTPVDGIDGLISDAEWIIKTVKNDDARDAALVAAAQYVEMYETAGYGTAIEWAEEMGHTEVCDLLEETLAEEKNANEKLTDLATNGINQRSNDMEEAEA